MNIKIEDEKIVISLVDADQLNNFFTLKQNDLEIAINKLYNEYKEELQDMINKDGQPIKNSNIIIQKEENDNNLTVVNEEEFINGEVETTITETNFIETEKIELIISKVNSQEQKSILTPEEIVLNDKMDKEIKSKQIILPNGKVNQSYKFIFDINNVGIPNIGDFWFDDFEKIGLSYNTDTSEIIGIPTISGEHKIKLSLKHKDWSEGKPIFTRPITIIINPDPKTLWNNIPTSSDIEYYKIDEDKEFLKVIATGFINKEKRKDIVAASQRGRSHAHEGKARDDDFKLSYDKSSEWYIITVADGAGSAKFSRKGSEIACKTAISVSDETLKKHLKDFDHLISEYNKNKTNENRKKVGDILYHTIGAAVFKAYKNIEEEAKLKNNPVKDYATTLIVSICKKFKFGWFVGAFWVGDGGIGIYNKETQYIKVLGESDGGEFAGQTRFLTMPEITQASELYRRLRFEIVDDFTAVILMTDGITDPKFETDANLLKIEKWNELWEDLSKEVEFKDDNEASADQLLKWLDFWSPGNHDDRTIAILF